MADVTATVWNEDCIRGMSRRLAPSSVHLTVTSIPFEELFSYSGKVEDVGNNGSTIDVRAGRFALNLRFVIEQLYRATAPGCNCCIHIQQLLAYKVQHGFMGRRDFRGAVIDLFRAAGWVYAGEAAQPNVLPLVTAGEVRDLLTACAGDDHLLTSHLLRQLGVPLPCEVAIPKDPQQMAQRLNLHSLQFKTGYARTATNWAMAPNDYVLVFQKPGLAEVPVRPLKHATNPSGWISQDDWIVWARGIWEIDAFDVLDGARKAKDDKHEKHVCPLQLELIRRLVLMYSNPATVQPDVLVLDPFTGIGSVPVVALECGRNAAGFELKESYHAAALDHIATAKKPVTPVEPDLFAGVAS